LELRFGQELKVDYLQRAITQKVLEVAISYNPKCGHITILNPKIWPYYIYSGKELLYNCLQGLTLYI